MIYFNIDEIPGSIPKQYGVWLKETAAKQFTPMTGSFSVLYARIVGLPYPEFLRMVRDNYGASVSGVNHLYPKITFSDKANAIELANLLDQRLLTIFKNIRRNDQ